MIDASKYDMETQLNPIAVIEKSVPIFLRATLTAAPMNGLKNWVAMVATSKRVLLMFLSVSGVDFMPLYYSVIFMMYKLQIDNVCIIIIFSNK